MTTPEQMAEVVNHPEAVEWRDRIGGLLVDGMGLQEYGERYLKNQGASAEQAKAQTDRAVALSERGDMLTEDLLKSKPVQPEVTKAQGELQGALTAKPEMAEKLNAQLGELGHPTIDALYDHMVRGGKLDHEALDQLDTEVADYLYAKARDHQQALEVLNAASHRDTQGDVDVPKDVADHTEGPTAAVKESLKNGNERQMWRRSWTG
jgi:hypothetical protein